MIAIYNIENTSDEDVNIQLLQFASFEVFRFRIISTINLSTTGKNIELIIK